MLNPPKISFFYIKLALLLFLISAFYGWLMRLNSFIDLPFFNYTKILQSHSHVTFLGWGYIALTVLFNYRFLPKNISFSKKYKIIFGLQIISISLMLISFPLQGYKIFSIILLSLFAILSYLYFYNFLNNYKKNKQAKHINLFIKASIFFYILAMFAIWAIGIVINIYGKGEIYNNTIYFYLHFLYNGFFTFGLLALFFNYLQQKNITISKKKSIIFFWLFAIACIPAYLLSLIKSENYFIIEFGFLAGLLQTIGLVYFYTIIKSIKQSVKSIIRMYFIVILISFTLKTLLQLASAFPIISNWIPQLKMYFVIGYIHLVTLGIISASLIALLIEFHFINKKNTSSKISSYFFIIGFIITETLLFTQGIFIKFFQTTIPYYTTALLIASSILLLGILLFSLTTFFKKSL